MDLGAHEYTTVNLGVLQFENNINITVYPIPAVNELNVVNESSIEITRYEIVDMNGRIVSKQTANIKKHTVININHLTNGQYIIILYNQNTVIKSVRILK